VKETKTTKCTENEMTKLQPLSDLESFQKLSFFFVINGKKKIFFLLLCGVIFFQSILKILPNHEVFKSLQVSSFLMSEDEMTKKKKFQLFEINFYNEMRAKKKLVCHFIKSYVCILKCNLFTRHVYANITLYILFFIS
jgi:hypothetical protein